MAGFSKLEPSSCKVLRDGKGGEGWTEIKARDLVPGDICQMEGGKTTPADILILSCQTLKVIMPVRVRVRHACALVYVYTQ